MALMTCCFCYLTFEGIQTAWETHLWRHQGVKFRQSALPRYTAISDFVMPSMIFYGTSTVARSLRSWQSWSWFWMEKYMSKLRRSWKQWYSTIAVCGTLQSFLTCRRRWKMVSKCTSEHERLRFKIFIIKLVYLFKTRRSIPTSANKSRAFIFIRCQILHRCFEESERKFIWHKFRGVKCPIFDHMSWQTWKVSSFRECTGKLFLLVAVTYIPPDRELNASNELSCEIVNEKIFLLVSWLSLVLMLAYMASFIKWRHTHRYM